MKDIIASVQIGDILTFSGHTKLIYDLEKDSQGNVIDAFIMEVTGGIGKSYVNTKVARHNYTLDGQLNLPHFFKLFLNSKLNPDFEESRIEGAVGLKRLSKYSAWKNINNIEKRMAEYSVLRIMQNDFPMEMLS